MEEEIYENPNQTEENKGKTDNKIQVEKSEDTNKAVSEKPSKAWYILPIFFGIIGGLIGYFIVKDRDKKMATNILIVGVVISAISIIFSVILISLGVLFYYGAFAPSGFIGPTARGFTSVMVVPPWDMKSNGDITLRVENRAGQDITINRIYVNGKETTNSNFPIDVSNQARSGMINFNTNSIGLNGETYSIKIAIEYCIKYQGCNQSFNSTGTISGTYS